MNKDEIIFALRFVAMGRPNHPEVERLAEFLAVPQQPQAEAQEAIDPPALDTISVEVPQPQKRGPGRPKKAE